MGLQWEYTARKAYGCGGSVTVSIGVRAEKFHGVKNREDCLRILEREIAVFDTEHKRLG
jgi:hypothetical protein